MKTLTVWLLLAGSLCAQGTFYDAIFYDSRALRLVDIPKLADAGFKTFASAFTPDDAPALKLCQDRGMGVIYSMNTGTVAQHKALWDAHSCVKWWSIGDDLDATSTPAKVTAAIAVMRPNLRPDMKTFGTYSKAANPATWANVTDVAHLQLYIYKEGTLRKWYWEYVLQWRAAHRGQLWIGPYLGKGVTPYFGLKDPVWSEESYTPVGYQKAAIWLGLCAGADDWLGYSAYSISPSYPKFSYRLTERWDILPGLTEIARQIKEQERFFRDGTRVTFDNGRFVGAQWSLPTGEALRVTVDTFEALPDVDIEPIPAPVVTTASLRITSQGNVKVEKLP